MMDELMMGGVDCLSRTSLGCLGLRFPVTAYGLRSAEWTGASFIRMLAVK